MARYNFLFVFVSMVQTNFPYHRRVFVVFQFYLLMQIFNSVDPEKVEEFI